MEEIYDKEFQKRSSDKVKDKYPWLKMDELHGLFDRDVPKDLIITEVDNTMDGISGEEMVAAALYTYKNK